MKNRKTPITLLALMVSMIAAGCVRPGEMDPRVIGRYQREMVRRGPQLRGETGLDAYRPGGETQPPLKIVRNETDGKAQVFLSLDETVYRALANSLDIRVVSFDPAISREEMVVAAGEFDYTVFAEFTYGDTRTRVPVSTSSDQWVRSERAARGVQAGVQQKTITGATWELGWDMSRTFDNGNAALIQRQYDSRISFDVVQPLLRDAWPEFNLSGVRIARLNYKVSMAEFRQRVEQVVTQTISLYWQLIQARRDVLIQEALLDRTVETYERIRKRGLMDATRVAIKQAEAAVETRRAGLIRSQKAVGDVEDAIARVLNDKQLNVLSDREIVPTTRMLSEKIEMDEADQLVTALEYNPVLAQARLAIALAKINIRVARNQSLPVLDLSASTGIQGAAGGAHEAQERMFTNDYYTAQVALRFEYPVGNRRRLAQLEQKMLEKLQAVAAMQNAADQLAVDIRERIRQINTSYEEIKAQTRAVEAAREQLEALEATEELQRLSPEFLQVKLSAQETLANAQRNELRAMVDYNTALADLSRATGTTLVSHRVRIAMPEILSGRDVFGDVSIPILGHEE